MMCLGWRTKPTCKTRGEVEVVPPEGCSNIGWFWAALAVIGLGALVKKQ
jgi:hypothetical protein